MSISLRFILEKLEKNTNVDCVFLTGSHGTGKQKPYSDIDLVVVFRKNTRNIKSVYTFIDGVFSDIFFFDLADVKRINGSKELDPNAFDAMFLDWLKKPKIMFDKSGEVSRLAAKSKIPKSKMLFGEQFNLRQQISYNYLSNKRYFESKDGLYHEALEIRLPYSVVQLITGYFALRDMPWRGEKGAVLWLKKNDTSFYTLFQKYVVTPGLTKRFKFYVQMTDKVLPKKYKLWNKNLVIALPKGQIKNDKAVSDLTMYWKSFLK